MCLFFVVLFCFVMLFFVYVEKLFVLIGKFVLIIFGKIGNMNVGDKVVFDFVMLEKLGMKMIEIIIFWYIGKVCFDGIFFSKFMDLVGVKGILVCVLVLNDYIIIILIDDFYKFLVIMVLKMNG